MNCGGWTREVSRLPTYDFQCDSCGLEFEVIGCRPGETSEPCPNCNGPEVPWTTVGHRIFKPGSWTQTHTGIFRPFFHVGLGTKVESRRQLREEIASIPGAAEKGSTSRRGRKEPSEQEIEKAIRDLKRSEVVAAREKREQLEYKERNG